MESSITGEKLAASAVTLGKIQVNALDAGTFVSRAIVLSIE